MAKLTETFSSKYFEAAHTIKGTKHRLVRVFVEGYDDVAFWRTVFDRYESETLRFEITVPVRADLAKGKRVVMSFLPECGRHMILCVDSDFDYLFGNFNDQSRKVNQSRYLFHTYTYATENYQCYPPSLHTLCVKATKNDADIFDFPRFMEEYSRIVYPLFLWYVFSARKNSQKLFTLNDFKNSVRINYLDIRENGGHSLEWLQRQVDKRLKILKKRRPDPGWDEDMKGFEDEIRQRGVTENNVYLFMQGHTLKDNVVLILLQSVCEKLREITNSRIANSSRQGTALKNELSNYNNSLRNVKDILDDNEGYKDCFLYGYLLRDIEKFLRENYPGDFSAEKA